MTYPADHTGKRFGRLVVVGLGPRHVSKSGKTRMTWRCRCDCGTDTNVRANNLTAGLTNSCGCLHRRIQPTLLYGQEQFTIVHQDEASQYWRDQAACVGQHELFHSRVQSGLLDQLRIAAAKKICATCPVRQPCLEFALSVNDRFGIFGGTTPAERLAMTLPTQDVG